MSSATRSVQGIVTMINENPGPLRINHSDGSASPMEELHEEKFDMLTVFQAAPLVWEDKTNGLLHPIGMLDFDYERKILKESLKDAARVNARVDLTFENATTDRLGAILATRRSHVLHFSCHGHQDYIAIENGKGGMQPLGVDNLRNLFSAGDGLIKVVFVSACHSRSAGEAFIAAGVSHVVCCHQANELRDLAAVEFARSFYRALACGRKLKESFILAQRAVMVSPDVPDAQAEMQNFLLLPEKDDDDPYHDVPVFYTGPNKCIPGGILANQDSGRIIVSANAVDV